jgi:hypothetical protein
MKIITAAVQTSSRIHHLLLVLITVLSLMPVPLIRAKPLATDVGGPIVSDTTWTLVNSPYIVVANVEVWQNVTLTIEPGVVVKFNTGRFLQVNGTLVARGTAGQPIVFTSNKANPQPGDWSGIVFADSSVDAVFDGAGNYLSGSVLQFCTVEYATRNGYSTYAAIDAQKAAPFVDHCTIRNNAATGIYITGSSSGQARVSNNTVSNNSSSIFAGGIQARYSIINNNTLSNNSATDDSGGGIAASNSTITNNVISNNSADPVHFGGGGIYATDESTISNNIITGNMSKGSGGGIFANGSSVTVVDNTISNNWALGGGGGITAWGTTVSDNIISFNSSTYGPGGGIDASGGTFSGNTVSHNWVYDSYGIGGGIYAYGDTVVINNTVTSNSVGSNGEGAGVYLNALYSASLNSNAIVGNIGSSSVTLDMIFPISSIEFHQNNLYGNSSYDVIVRRQYDINGTNNYWGTTASVDILAQVYDFYDDSSRGRLLYSPYLQQPDSNAPLPPPLNLQKVLTGTTVTLSWQALPSATTGYGYKVYYGPNSAPPYNGSGLPQGNSPIDVGNQTQLTLTGLSQGQIYYFTVTAYDTQGRESWYSNVVSATPPPPGPPAAPSNLQATAIDPTQIRLNWNDNSSDEAGFRIYEGATLITTVATNTISYTVGGLAPNSSHCYQVFAFNNYGQNGSNSACATTPPAPTYTFSGQVTDTSGNPIAGVILSDGVGHTATTNTSGNYTLSGLVAGTYTITPTKNDYRFLPASLSVSVPPSKTGQNFTGKLCKSPHTGIDICQLQKGDILLAFGQLGSIPQVARMIAGTYWFHVAIWVDDQTNFDGKLLAHATGPSTYVSNTDQVKTQSVYETYWWTGTGLYDWAVIRPLTTETIKTQAVTYAGSKADQQNPDILYNISFLDKNREDRFYCSQLVWKAYQKQGLDLEADKGLVNPVVTPDDLYYSLYDRATLVQTKGSSLDRMVFRLHSPANMLLVNPLGKRVGFDPATQQIVNEIPGAYYIGPNDEPEALSVGVPDISGWKLIVTGTGNGSYSLDAEVVDPSTPISQTVTLTTSPGQVDTYYIVDPNTSGGQLIKKVQPIFLPLIMK